MRELIAALEDNYSCWQAREGKGREASGRTGGGHTHAWARIYLPGCGWVDFDPTNDLIPGEEHVTIAHGRDFSDVTPLRGVILGGGAHTLAVSVDVTPFDAQLE